MTNPMQINSTLPDTITVTGSANASSMPDMATFIIGIEQCHTDIVDLYRVVNETITQMIHLLRDNGVLERDILLEDVNVEYFEEADRETRISKRLVVTLRELSRLETLFELVIQNGSNTLYGLNYGLIDPSALETASRLAALEDAHDRAQSIADHLGFALGAVVTVTENALGRIPYSPGGHVMLYRDGSGSVIEPGTVVVSTSVTVTYRLANR